jgi:hypothetical protein
MKVHRIPFVTRFVKTLAAAIAKLSKPCGRYAQKLTCDKPKEAGPDASDVGSYALLYHKILCPERRKTM